MHDRQHQARHKVGVGRREAEVAGDEPRDRRVAPGRQQQTRIGHRSLEVDRRAAAAPCHRPGRWPCHQQKIAFRQVETGAVVALDTAAPLDHLAEHDDVGRQETYRPGIVRLHEAPEDGLRLEQENDLRQRIHYGRPINGYG
jgi:hypothetical protein